MASFTNYQVGLGHVGSYQVSGTPYITGSSKIVATQEDKIRFPRVAKAVTIINTDASNADLYVHFNPTGSGDVIAGMHYIKLGQNKDSITLTMKCSEIYISAPSTNLTDDGSYTLIAELTSIPDGEMITLTGSGLTTSDSGLGA